MWVIRSVGGVISGVAFKPEVDDETGDALYWSNEDGWVSLETADRFDSKNYNLPIGGEWELDAD